MTSTPTHTTRPAPGARRTAGSNRTGPPGRRDARRPGAGSPPVSALRAAALREREQRPPYWFACRLLLVLSGQRPVHSLLRYTRGPGYDALCHLAQHAPLRPSGADRTTPAVLTARGSTPQNGVIEASARIVTGGSQRALAFRLEYCPDRRWRCTAVELDGMPAAGAGRRRR